MDIPDQEGLRILPAAPVLGLESGAEDYKGGTVVLRAGGWRQLCVYSVYVHTPSAS